MVCGKPSALAFVLAAGIYFCSTRNRNDPPVHHASADFLLAAIWACAEPKRRLFIFVRRKLIACAAAMWRNDE
jgi:hypothetical protein